MCTARARYKLAKRLVSLEGIEKLRSYKYHGRDLSLTYKYFLSPLAEKCLCIVPTWMAPNLVTLSGLLISFVGYLLLYFYCPTFSSRDAPRWVLPVVGIGLFTYQTLDNMDGKHARRTGSGSPLGLLFDHGCDAINCIFGTFVFANTINTGLSPFLLTLCFANQAIPFFWATWEEYHIGEMNLPIINGPSEGMLVGVTLAISNYFTGPDFWWNPILFPEYMLPLLRQFPILKSITPASAVLAISATGIICTIVAQTFSVLRHAREHRKSSIAALYGLMGFVTLGVSAITWLGSCPELVHSHPHACIFLVGTINVEMLCGLMLAHITSSPFKPFRPLIFPMIVLSVMKFANFTLKLNPVFILWAYLLTSTCYLAFRIVTMAIEVRDALGIYVFSLKKRSVD